MDSSKSLYTELGTALYEFGISFYKTFLDAVSLAKKAKERLPIFWYLMTGLTITPICHDIPQFWVAPFLFGYCICSLVVCFSDYTKKVQTLPSNGRPIPALISNLKLAKNQGV